MSFVALTRARVTVLVAMVIGASVGFGVFGLAGSSARPSSSRVAARGLRGLGDTAVSATAKELATSTLKTSGAKVKRAPRRVGERLSWLSRVGSDTFAAGGGRLETRIYPGPVNYRTTSGAFAAIKPSLKMVSGGYAQTANDLGVRLPAQAARLARVSTARGSLKFGLAGASAPGRVSGTTDEFVGALPGVKLTYVSEDQGVGWQASMTSSSASQVCAGGCRRRAG
jgi:hypothetical protein